MAVFLMLFYKIIPLYFLIFLGFIAGKYLKSRNEAISAILIYIIAPVIVFNGVATTKIDPGSLSLPFLFFLLGSLSCFIFYKIGGYFWKDSTKNILAFGAGAGNTGYFGVPVAYALLTPDLAGLVILSMLGTILFETTVGFYITARGSYSIRESIMKVIKLPSLYAFFLGLLVNFLGVPLGDIYQIAAESFKGTYTVLGMMIIGLGLSCLVKLDFDYKFIGLSFLAKFVFWPLLAALIIFADQSFFHFYNSGAYQVLILMSLVPLAANSVAYASALNCQPQKASLAVLLTTLFALIYIPLVVTLLM